MIRFRGREGMGTLPAFILVTFCGGLGLLAWAMVATGVWQAYALPILKKQAVHAVARVKQVQSPAAPADSAKSAPEDSLRALVTQIETQRALAETEAVELRALRSEIDSLLASFRDRQNAEAARQATLLGGMQPEEAARILSAMDDPSLNAVLYRMKPKAASRVMARLDPERLARISMEGLGAQTLASLTLPPGSAGEAAPTPENAGR